MSIRPVSTTMGQQTLAGISGVGWYRYNGKQPLEKPECPSAPLPQNVKATTAKEKRFAEFTRLRLEGKDKNEAGAAIGVSSSTAGYYDRAFLEEHPEARDA